MEALIELMWILFSVTILFLVPFVMFVVYLIKRNGFYMNVNCWFCNSWTKVFYTDRNSFYCPTCLQYNGFKEDGDYNKVIEAQYDTPLNKYKKTAPTANGLCTYCNNNQQLKIYQLANFVPLNDSNYDTEVDHFKKQLEKGYKLCKTCDHVLKTTIEKQHAWIFENHLRSSQNKNTNSVDISKKSQRNIKGTYWFCLNFIKFVIILCLIVIISQTLDINVDNLRSKFNMPNIFIPYLLFFKDIYTQATKVLTNITEYLNEQDFYPLKKINFKTSSMLPLTCLGFLLQIIITSCDQRHNWWKLNQLLGWILLNITSVIPSDHFYFTYVKFLQAFCSAIIMWSLLSHKTIEINTRKNPGFKKFTKSLDNKDRVSKSAFSSSSMESSRNMMNQCKEYMTDHSPSCLMKNKVQISNNHNNSFSTATSNKTASVYNRNRNTNSELSSNSDLSNSLDNLHLGSPKLPTCTSPVFSVSSTNRPILSPSKLKNITQNSWTAGGFWKNDNVFPVSTNLSPVFTNLSRSSSQTSGFISNGESVNTNVFNSPPPSREPSVCGDYEKTSIFSEPSHHFRPINSNGLGSYQSASVFPNHVLQSPGLFVTPTFNSLYYKATNNVFYPVLNQNSMLLLQGGNHSSNCENSFSNLSLRNFNVGSNGVNSPPLFENQPVVSSLFKNLSSIRPQSDNFKVPQC